MVFRLVFSFLVLALQTTVYASILHILGENGGAKPAEKHQYPFMVRMDSVKTLVEFDGVKQTQNHSCGAFLIQVPGNTEESDMVLTAAHCIVKRRPWPTRTYEEISSMRLVFGVHARAGLDTDSQERNVSNWEYHPDFYPDEVDSELGIDIAIIKVDPPVKYSANIIESISLPLEGEELVAGDDCILAGWGAIRDGDAFKKEYPDVLYHMNASIIDERTCRERIEEAMGSMQAKQFNLESIYCVSPGHGALPSACGGDSGSPLFRKEHEEWVAYGIASRASSSCSGHQNHKNWAPPSFYEKITPRLNWINTMVKKMSSVGKA